MRKSVFVIGARSALAKEAISILKEKYDIVTGGRADCDVYCDIAKEVNIPKNIDIVINFAAAFGGNSDKEITETIQTNLGGILNICKAAKKAGVSHIISMSSVSALIDETSPYYSIYAITKKQADEVASFYCKLNDINLTILLPSQIYGDSEEFAKHQPLFYVMVDKAERGEDITIYGKHDALRNYIHASDIANIIELVAQKSLVGIYVCSSSKDVSYSQIARAAQSVFKKGGKILFLKDKPDIPDNIFTYDGAIYDKLGYLPQITLEDGLKRIKKYREPK